MTKHALDPTQLRLVEMIGELHFGHIRQIPVRHGKLCIEAALQTIQEIKLGSEIGSRIEQDDTDLTLKVEFERLFDRLRQLHDARVDIEIRHGVPFRLFVMSGRGVALP